MSTKFIGDFTMACTDEDKFKLQQHMGHVHVAVTQVGGLLTATTPPALIRLLLLLLLLFLLFLPLLPLLLLLLILLILLLFLRASAPPCVLFLRASV